MGCGAGVALRSSHKICFWRGTIVGENRGIEEGKRKRRTKICFVRAMDVSLKYAVGPSGRCTIVIASINPNTSKI